MLGHSSIAITADTYGHWTDEGREDVATRLERAILGSQNGVATTLATQRRSERFRRLMLNLKTTHKRCLEECKPDSRGGVGMAVSRARSELARPVFGPSGARTF